MWNDYLPPLNLWNWKNKKVGLKMKTLEELKDYITHNVDEIDLLEYLDLRTADLVSSFSDLIEENYDKLIEELELLDEPEQW